MTMIDMPGQTGGGGGDESLSARTVALGGDQIGRLAAALEDAFTLDQLHQLLVMGLPGGLSLNLEAVVPVAGRTVHDICHDLVLWALQDARVGLEGLLAGALALNPTNPQLLGLQKDWAGVTFTLPACPYPGMKPFTAADQGRFYGRDAEIAEAVDRLRRFPFLAIIGSSGSGKSSLLAAGILPALARSDYFADKRWTVRSMRPGAAPYDTLAALVGLNTAPLVTPAPHTSAPSTTTSGALALPTADGTRLLVVVDQFEELFTTAAADQRERFEQVLLQLLQTPDFYFRRPPIQEIRESLPKPPLPEINRIRGQVGFDTNILQIQDQNNTLSQFGFVLRLDATRLGGSYWNIHGYHRGKVQSSTDYQHQTLTDLINRTYQLRVTYDNPHSRWVIGAGRLFVPWASSLSTMDGFYLGRRIGKETVGVFGGTNPDPTSWNYDPDRQMGGAFVNTERGDYDSFRYSGTAGIAVSGLDWQTDRQFGFFENRLFYKTYMSISSNVEVDLLSSANSDGQRELVLSRSYLTMRWQPHKVVSLDLSENYFRNIPTFDARLIGTGLLDQFLFQGISGGVRLALPYHLGIFGNTGRSSRTGDQRATWNYLGGASIGDILHSAIRAEYRYSRFDTSFGRGIYQTVLVSREVGEGLRFEIQLGQQSIESTLTAQDRAHFINGNVDWNVRGDYLIGGGITVYRGEVQNYNQYVFNFGYRFDNRRR